MAPTHGTAPYTTLTQALQQAEREHAPDERSGSPRCVRQTSVTPTRGKLDELIRSVEAGNETLADLTQMLDRSVSPGVSQGQ